MPRTNLRDALPDVKNAKIVARNTFAYMRLDGTRVFRLHYTDIVEILPDGRVKLSSGGWKTVTTKDRIRQFAPGLDIYSDKGTWYVRALDGSGRSCPFYDGIVLPDAFDKPSNIPAKEAKLKAQIKKFVCDTIPAKGELPKPSNGDCWFCLMIDAEKPATRETNGHTIHNIQPRDSGHLREHIKEKYMTGSLIVNALRDNGIADTGISYYLHGRLGDNKRVRSTVRKYIGKRLGLAV